MLIDLQHHHYKHSSSYRLCNCQASSPVSHQHCGHAARLAPSTSAPMKSHHNQYIIATSITAHGTGAEHTQLPVSLLPYQMKFAPMSQKKLRFKLAHTYPATASVMQPQSSHMSIVPTWSSAWYLVVRTCTRRRIMFKINPRDGLDGVTDACAGTGWEQWRDLGCSARSR